MSTATRTLTYADLGDLPAKREGDRHELIEGVLYVTPAPVPYHELVTMECIALVLPFIRAGRLGRLLSAPVDVKLSDRDVVEPDLVFVRTDRLQIIGPAAIVGAPDLVVEILSPSTRQRDLGLKRALYERHGVQEYWLADPDARTLTIHALKGGSYKVVPPAADGRLHCIVLSGLSIDPAAFFAAADLS